MPKTIAAATRPTKTSSPSSGDHFVALPVLLSASLDKSEGLGCAAAVCGVALPAPEVADPADGAAAGMANVASGVVAAAGLGAGCSVFPVLPGVRAGRAVVRAGLGGLAELDWLTGLIGLADLVGLPVGDRAGWELGAPPGGASAAGPNAGGGEMRGLRFGTRANDQPSTPPALGRRSRAPTGLTFHDPPRSAYQ